VGSVVQNYGAEHIQQKMRKATLQGMEKLCLKRAEHPEPRCPVNLSEIERIEGFSFDVLIDQPRSITPKTWEPLSDDEVLKMVAEGETNAVVEFKIGACRNPYTGKRDDRSNRAFGPLSLGRRMAHTLPSSAVRMPPLCWLWWMLQPTRLSTSIVSLNLLILVHVS
jgi:hypothetical protein